MPDKFQRRYRIQTNRLRGYDYGSNGAYFVTICTKNKVCYFGTIDEQAEAERLNSVPSFQPTNIGQIAFDYWVEIPNHYPFVILDEFVIMPNHVHGILFFDKPDKTDWKPNEFGPQTQNLGAVIRAYKSSLKRFANQNLIEFEWQSRYHDKVIWDERELNAIRNYIIDNPVNWKNDEFNIQINR